MNIKIWCLFAVLRMESATSVNMGRATYFRSLIDKRIRISYNFHTLDYKQQTKDLSLSVCFLSLSASLFSRRPPKISSKRRDDNIESNEIESNRNHNNKA